MDSKSTNSGGYDKTITHGRNQYIQAHGVMGWVWFQKGSV